MRDKVEIHALPVSPFAPFPRVSRFQLIPSSRTRRPDHLQNDGFVRDFAVDLPARITEKAYDPNNLRDPINRYHPALRADRSKHSAELRVMD